MVRVDLIKKLLEKEKERLKISRYISKQASLPEIPRLNKQDEALRDECVDLINEYQEYLG